MRLSRVALAALFACLTAGSPLPAAAHAILLESQPEGGAVVAAGPAEIRLRFNSRIDQGRSRIELRRADRAVLVLPLSPAGPDMLVAQTTLSAGDWVLRWQVLAVDGHITRGDVLFSVRAR